MVAVMMMVTVNGMTMDLTGTGRDAPTVYDTNTGMWYSYVVSAAKTKAGEETATMETVQWGGMDFDALSGDFDADGIDDYVAYDREYGYWYIYSGAKEEVLTWGEQWGYSGCEPKVADFNGDGTDDISVWDPASYQWYFRYSAATITKKTKSGKIVQEKTEASTEQVDMSGFRPNVVENADLDGDGVTDLIKKLDWTVWYQYGDDHWNRIDFYMDLESNPTIPTLICEDMNNDGKVDICGYNEANGRWEIFYLKTNQYDQVTYDKEEFYWGYPGTEALPADYDGNGLTDLAVYDTNSAMWWVAYNSQEGYYRSESFQWGYDGTCKVK